MGGSKNTTAQPFANALTGPKTTSFLQDLLDSLASSTFTRKGSFLRRKCLLKHPVGSKNLSVALSHIASHCLPADPFLYAIDSINENSAHIECQLYANSPSTSGSCRLRYGEKRLGFNWVLYSLNPPRWLFLKFASAFDKSRGSSWDLLKPFVLQAQACEHGLIWDGNFP
jgi:hypothetical protein